MLRQVFTIQDSLVQGQALIDVAKLNQCLSLQDSCLRNQDGRLSDILSDVLHEGAQGQDLWVVLKVNESLTDCLQSMQDLTWLQYLLVLENGGLPSTPAIEQFSERVAAILNRCLWMRQRELCRCSEELRCHQHTLSVLVQILAFVAELGKFGQHNSSYDDLFRTESIR